MPSVEFQGVQITLPASDGLHFAFQKGVMVINFDNFTGKVVMTPAAEKAPDEEEIKATAQVATTTAATAATAATATTTTTRRGRKGRENKRLSPHTPPDEDAEEEPEIAVLERTQDTTVGSGDECPQQQELAICEAPPRKETGMEPAAKRRLIETPASNFVWRKIDTQSSSEPEACWGASAALISPHEVLVYGGDDGDNTISDVWIVDRDNWSWSKVNLAFPGKPRAWHSATLVGTTMVVFGGEENLGEENGRTKSFNDIAIFDTEARVWFPAHVTGTPPSPRGGHTATAIPGRNKVMVFGGISGSKWLNDVHVLDTGVWNWYKPTVRGSPPRPRSYHSATAVGNKVVVFGGNGSSKCFKEVYVLDTETWAWSQPEMQGEAPLARTGHSATAGADGRSITVFGGWDYKDSYSTSKIFSDVHILDTLTWQWRQPTVSGASPAPRCGQAACFIEDENSRPAVFVFGGQLQGERKCNDVYLLSLS